MTRRVMIFVAMMVIGLAVVAGYAQGKTVRIQTEHICASDFGGYSNYSERYVVFIDGSGPAFTNTNESDWGAGQPYYARRKYSDYSISYEHYVSGAGNWSFTNSIDVYRTTSIKNGNGASDTYDEEQYASGSC